MNSVISSPLTERPVSVTEAVVFGITRQIHEARRALDSEESGPGSNPDASDDKIKSLKARILKLCALRDEYEVEMAKGI